MQDRKVFFIKPVHQFKVDKEGNATTSRIGLQRHHHVRHRTTGEERRRQHRTSNFRPSGAVGPGSEFLLN